MSCLATTAMWVEMQSPLFSADAWAAYHTMVLAHIADDDLAASDFGIDISWCAAVREAFPTRPTCLVTPAAAATHLNTHAIEKFMSKPVRSTVRSCAGTCRTLNTRRFQRPPHGLEALPTVYPAALPTAHTQLTLGSIPGYWRNFSHHTGDCWGIELGARQQRGLTRKGRFSIDSSGYARARQPPALNRNTQWTEPRHASQRTLMRNVSDAVGDGSSATVADEDSTQPEPARPICLGATSVGSHDGSRISGLVSSLQQLMSRERSLRIVINHHDGPGGDQPRQGAPLVHPKRQPNQEPRTMPAGNELRL